VLDLEDAVATAEKPHARADAVSVLRTSSGDTCHLVRVNAMDDRDLLEADLDALSEVLDKIAAVVLPKTGTAEEVRELVEALQTRAATSPPPYVVPTIETAAGVGEAWRIAAASEHVHTLLFGSVDLSADLGVPLTADGLELLTARSTVVMACAAAGRAKPIDGPHLNIDDAEGLMRSARHARSIGFGGKVVVHPAQLAGVRAAFAPAPEEVDWAARVVEAFEDAVKDGVAVLRLADGTFVDAPVVARARAILQATGTEAGR